MSKGVKLLVCALESVGKTTMTSKLEKSMVIAIDSKPYPFNVPHYEVREFNGVIDFKNVLIDKIKVYKEKFGELPKTVILDTVTKLYELIYLWAEDNYKGFDQHNAISKATLQLNSMLDKLLVDRGINLVVTAHTQYDINTNRFIIPATGAFKNSGSWLSVVDNAVYMYILGTERMVAHNDVKFPCRTTLDGMKSGRVDDYDINEHMKELEDMSGDIQQNLL